MKVIRKEYLLRQNGIQKGKGLDLGAEPPRINFLEYPRVLPAAIAGFQCHAIQNRSK